MRIRTCKLYVYDWELSDMRTHLWDLYHFMIFDYLRINTKNDKQIIKLLFNDIKMNNYIKIYLNKTNGNAHKELYLALFSFQLF